MRWGCPIGPHPMGLPVSLGPLALCWLHLRYGSWYQTGFKVAPSQGSFEDLPKWPAFSNQVGACAKPRLSGGHIGGGGRGGEERASDC